MSDLIADFVRTENLSLQAIKTKDRTKLLRASQQRLFKRTFMISPDLKEDTKNDRRQVNETQRKSVLGRRCPLLPDQRRCRVLEGLLKLQFSFVVTKVNCQRLLLLKLAFDMIALQRDGSVTIRID
jgi:hypothetical protein